MQYQEDKWQGPLRSAPTEMGRYVFSSAAFFSVFLLLALTPATSEAIIEYGQPLGCANFDPDLPATATERPGFKSMWDSVAADETGLSYAFVKANNLLRATGPDRNWLNNCSVEKPEETVNSNPVFRRVQFDKAWTYEQKVEGSTFTRSEHHGFRFEYSYDKKQKSRKLRTMQVCRNAEGCKALGFPGAVTTAKPVKYDEPNPCASDLFDEVWPALENLEALPAAEGEAVKSALLEVAAKSIKESGKKTPTRCKVIRPVAEDEMALTKNRRVFIYNLWPEKVVIDGFDYETLRMNGLQVDFRSFCTEQDDGEMNCSKRRILGYTVCRSEDACSGVGIVPDEVDKQRVAATLKHALK